MLDGPERGLAELDELIEGGDLDGYYLLWATRADLTRRCHRLTDAAADYERALNLATNPAERRFLTDRMAECRGPADIAGPG